MHRTHEGREFEVTITDGFATVKLAGDAEEPERFALPVGVGAAPVADRILAEMEMMTLRLNAPPAPSEAEIEAELNAFAEARVEEARD